MQQVNHQWSEGSTQRSAPRERAAFTLAELLIVVLIIATVTVATIPLLKPAMDSRRIREAARIVTTQLAAAQNEAVASGHSVGVWFEKIHTGGTSGIEGTASMDLYLCEVPQPYSGDSTTSTVVVNVSGTPLLGTVTMNPTDTAWAGLVHDDDQIQFNNSGPYYKFRPSAAQVNSDGTLIPGTQPFKIMPVDQDDLDSSGNPAFRHLPPAAFTGSGWTTSFTIFRRPVKSSNTPVQLPSGAVIDTHFSGMGSSTFSNNDNNPLLVMFDRTGALSYVYVGGTRSDVTAPLYLLIGKREKVFSITFSDLTNQNWADQDNLWISINPQSGLASTTEVAPGVDWLASRGYATSAQAMGGK